jgi:hypothetical protein
MLPWLTVLSIILYPQPPGCVLLRTAGEIDLKEFSPALLPDGGRAFFFQFNQMI